MGSETIRISKNKEDLKNGGDFQRLRKNQITHTQDELLAVTRILPIIDQLPWFKQFQNLYDGRWAHEKNTKNFFPKPLRVPKRAEDKKWNSMIHFCPKKSK